MKEELTEFYIDFGPMVFHLGVGNRAPESYWHKYSGVIRACSEDGTVEEDIGTIDVTYFDLTSAVNNGWGDFCVIDSSSMNYIQYLTQIYDPVTEQVKTSIEE